MTTSSGELLVLLAVASESSEEKVLQLLIQLGAQVVGASEGSLLVYDPAGNDLVFAMTVGGPALLIGQRVPLNQGLTGLAAATREVQIGAPTFKVRQAPGNPQGENPQSVIAAPMLVGDELVGVITAVSFDPDKRFSSRDGELYGRLAAIAGVVVEQRRKLKSMTDGAEGDSVAPVERSIALSLKHIAKNGPDALARAARILAEVEALSATREHEG
ncbi:MAG: GAF domain-containing protein [Pseudomonadota bacterium]